MKSGNVKQLIFFVFLLVSITTELRAQEIVEHPKKANLSISKTDTIPFELSDYNNILVPAVFNSLDSLILMFHLAQGNAVSLIEAASAKAKSIEYTETLEGLNTWGGQSDSRYAENNKLQIGSFKWDSVAIHEGKFSGHYSDGKFGPYLFKERILEIDFDQEILVLHTKFPMQWEACEKIPVSAQRGMLFMKGSLELKNKEIVEQEFLLHSGHSGALLLDDEFVLENKISDQVNVYSESQLLDSGGNVIKTKKAMLPAFFLGNQQFDDLPIAFFGGKMGRQRISVLGGDLLKRYNWVIDLSNNFVCLKQNTLNSSVHFDLKE